MSEEISKIRKRLEELEERIFKLEKLHEAKPEAEPHLILRERIEKLAKDTSLSSEQLGNVFEFSEQDLRFIAPLTGSVPEKQVNFAQCVLIGSESVYQKKSVAATDLSRQLDDYGLDTANLARTLGNRSDLFRKIGKKRQTLYKLTDIGKTSAIQLVRTLATPPHC
jgi:hypothetical protein